MAKLIHALVERKVPILTSLALFGLTLPNLIWLPAYLMQSGLIGRGSLEWLGYPAFWHTRQIAGLFLLPLLWLLTAPVELPALKHGGSVALRQIHHLLAIVIMAAMVALSMLSDLAWFDLAALLLAGSLYLILPRTTEPFFRYSALLLTIGFAAFLFSRQSQYSYLFPLGRSLVYYGAMPLLLFALLARTIQAPAALLSIRPLSAWLFAATFLFELIHHTLYSLAGAVATANLVRGVVLLYWGGLLWRNSVGLRQLWQDRPAASLAFYGGLPLFYAGLLLYSLSWNHGGQFAHLYFIAGFTMPLLLGALRQGEWQKSQSGRRLITLFALLLIVVTALRLIGGAQLISPLYPFFLALSALIFLAALGLWLYMRFFFRFEK